MTASGRAIARAGLIVTAAYLASRILGYVRTAVISTQFGASPDLDSYFAAFRIPDAIFQLVAAGAVASALIPIVTELLVQGEESRAWRVVSTIANLMLIALLVLAGAFFVLAPTLMPLITPGFDAAHLDQTVRLTRVMLLSPILLALGAVTTSVLNATGRFAVSAAAPLLYNLGIIGGALFLAPSMGVDGLALGVVAGSAANLGIQVLALARQRFGYAPSLDLGDTAARTVLILMLPRAIGLAATQITFLVNNGFASGLGEGAITVYNVAFTMLQIPIGVVGVPLSIVMLPAMSHALASGATERFAELTDRSLRLLAFITLPATGLALVLSTQAVAFLFRQGRFDAAATVVTGDLLVVFSLGLVAHAMITILADAFYAGKDTRTPVLAAVIAVAVNVVVAVATVGPLGLRGLALAITLGAWAEVIVLLVLLERRIPAVRLAPLARGLATLLPGAAAATVAAYAVHVWLDGSGPGDASKLELAAQLLVPSAVAAAVFLGIAVALRLPELQTTRQILSALGTRRSVA